MLLSFWILESPRTSINHSIDAVATRRHSGLSSIFNWLSIIVAIMICPWHFIIRPVGTSREPFIIGSFPQCCDASASNIISALNIEW